MLRFTDNPYSDESQRQFDAYKQKSSFLKRAALVVNTSGIRDYAPYIPSPIAAVSPIKYTDQQSSVSEYLNSPRVTLSPGSQFNITQPIGDTVRLKETTDVASTDIEKMQFEQDYEEIKSERLLLGTHQTAEGQLSAFDPAIERWNWKRLNSESEKVEFKHHLIKNIDTMLKERYQIPKSEIKYLIDDQGKLRNEHFKTEPFEKVIERGITVRGKDLSPEQIRERSELIGFRKVQSMIGGKNTPLGTTAISFSPPGMEKDTPYKYKFIDLFTLKEDQHTGERYVELTRLAVDLDYDGYIDKAKEIDPNYFIGMKGQLDAWMLEHPLQLASANKEEFILNIMKEQKNLSKIKLFEKNILLLMPLILKFVDELCQYNDNYSEVKLVLNALLNISDLQMAKKNIFVSGTVKQSLTNFINYYGRQRVIPVAAACGLSSGYDTNGTKNSVAQFSGECRKIRCRGCAWEANESEAAAISAGSMAACPKCGWRPDGKQSKENMSKGKIKNDTKEQSIVFNFSQNNNPKQDQVVK